MSVRCCPRPLWKKIGSPPTAPKARAGEFTPPGISFWARAKAAWLRGLLVIGRWAFKGTRWLAGVEPLVEIIHHEGTKSTKQLEKGVLGCRRMTSDFSDAAEVAWATPFPTTYPEEPFSSSCPLYLRGECGDAFSMLLTYCYSFRSCSRAAATAAAAWGRSA